MCVTNYKQNTIASSTTPTTTRTMGDMFGEIDDDVFSQMLILPTTNKTPLPLAPTTPTTFGEIDDDVLSQMLISPTTNKTPLPPAPTTPTTTRTMGDMFGEIDDDVFSQMLISPTTNKTPLPLMLLLIM